MNSEIKTEWLAALRSGEYKQGTRALNTEAGMCCLGVLCDLYVKKGNTQWVEEFVTENSDVDQMLIGQTIKGITDPITKHTDFGILPIEVQNWAGLVENNPLTVPNKKEDLQYISALNDQGLTFSQIADIIQYSL